MPPPIGRGAVRVWLGLRRNRDNPDRSLHGTCKSAKSVEDFRPDRIAKAAQAAKRPRLRKATQSFDFCNVELALVYVESISEGRSDRIVKHHENRPKAARQSQHATRRKARYHGKNCRGDGKAVIFKPHHLLGPDKYRSLYRKKGHADAKGYEVRNV
jgi:hypothetical protein